MKGYLDNRIFRMLYSFVLTVIAILAYSFASYAQEQDGDKVSPGSKNPPGKIERAADATERGVERGAKATGRGLERAGKATGRGLKRAANATERGLKRAGNATGRGLKKGGEAVEKTFSGKESGQVKSDNQ